MLIGREMFQALAQFMDPVRGSSVCQLARVSVEMPNKELYDIAEFILAENKILGARETHRLIIRVQPEVASPGDVMKKVGDVVMK
jgi:hypothetical protein|tara:strand:+ start:1233 stop:1487 length:255 start_codon:yes stop_codon:yes gene_type:complete